jgi:predicted nucleotide-binding protein
MFKGSNDWEDNMSQKKQSLNKPVSVKPSQADKQESKQSRLMQTVCPLMTLETALKIPRAIKDNFAGKAVQPLLVADACGIKSTSSNWRAITGAAVAYGLTNGASNAPKIAITTLGERIVAPSVEGDDKVALKEATMKPTVLADFYRQYDGNKMPKQEIAYKLLKEKGVPIDRVNAVWEIIKANAKYTNILRVFSGDEHIFLNLSENLDIETETKDSILSDAGTEIIETTEESDLPHNLIQKMNISPPAECSIPSETKKEKPNIFISHGKNDTVIVGQLKELLVYGQMEPVVSVERETTAKPVPHKVFDDMRRCNAGIIHIDLDKTPHDEDNLKYSRLNENVLIEIGAAIALYRERVVLLCKKGTELPSNLQGLYRCEYEGNQLDYASTIKLLKTMQDLREKM